jgi:hypothetical protein
VICHPILTTNKMYLRDVSSQGFYCNNLLLSLRSPGHVCLSHVFITLITNRIINSLVVFYKQIESDLENLFIFENKLLLYYNRLIVPNT